MIKINSIDIKNYDHWVVDLQGAELLALEGSIQNLKFCKTLYIEVSEGEVYNNGAKWNDILNFLSKNKYRQMWDLKSNHTNVLFIKSN